MEERKKIFKLNTGSTALNDMLGGGVESRSITEVYGEFRTGKSQLCHTLCVSCQVRINLWPVFTPQFPKEQGGGGGKALYIDTEGSFRPERIMQIAERFGLDSEAALNNVCFARCHNVDMMFSLLVQAAAMMHEDKFVLLGKMKFLKLANFVVVDSVMHHFRTEYNGRGELSVR